LFRHLKSRRSSATPATLNALRLEANKNQQFSFVLNPNSGLKVIMYLFSLALQSHYSECQNSHFFDNLYKTSSLLKCRRILSLHLSVSGRLAS
jgi:hypothetical protein